MLTIIEQAADIQTCEKDCEHHLGVDHLTHMSHILMSKPNGNMETTGPKVRDGPCTVNISARVP